MAKAAELKPFKVVKTPKIKDNRDKYVKRGEMAMLNKATAAHYHALGYIQISMEGIFDDNKADTDSTKSDSEVGESDENPASEDATADAGESETKTTPRMEAISRRRRTTS